jgi:hypothetical protein
MQVGEGDWQVRVSEMWGLVEKGVFEGYLRGENDDGQSCDWLFNEVRRVVELVRQNKQRVFAGELRKRQVRE